MIRNLKILVLALAAMCAMSVMAASAAHALPELTTSQHGHITGEQIGNVESTIGSRAALCEEVKLSAVSTVSQTTLTSAPQYAKCKTTPVLGVVFQLTVTMNGCDYLFHTVGLDGATYTANLDLVCPAGKVVELHFYSDVAHTKEVCTMTTAPQTGKTKLELTNIAGSPNDVLMHIDLTTTTTIHDKSGTNLCGTGTTTTLEGTVTLKAFNTEGLQVGLTASGT